jgi:hypothetical protein
MYAENDLRRRLVAVCSLIFALLIVPGSATSAGAQATPVTPPTCLSDSTYHVFDFWLGSWNVVDSAGAKLGSNRIERIVDGCAIMENWTEPDGSEGKSLFYYATDQRRWKQVWVTPNAMSPGGFKEKRLVARLPGGGIRFQGEIVGPVAITLDRTTLTPMTGGKVRQLIEVSRNGGTSWITTFDAIYVPVQDGKAH